VVNYFYKVFLENRMIFIVVHCHYFTIAKVHIFAMIIYCLYEGDSFTVDYHVMVHGIMFLHTHYVEWISIFMK